MDTNLLPFCQFDMAEVVLRKKENIASLDNVGWVKNVVDSTRFDRIDTNCGHVLRRRKVHVSLFHGS